MYTYLEYYLLQVQDINIYSILLTHSKIYVHPILTPLSSSSFPSLSSSLPLSSLLRSRPQNPFIHRLHNHQSRYTTSTSHIGRFLSFSPPRSYHTYHIIAQHSYVCMYVSIFDKPRRREENIHTRRRLSFMRVVVFRYFYYY